MTFICVSQNHMDQYNFFFFCFLIFFKMFSSHPLTSSLLVGRTAAFDWCLYVPLQMCLSYILYVFSLRLVDVCVLLKQE